MTFCGSVNQKMTIVAANITVPGCAQLQLFGPGGTGLTGFAGYPSSYRLESITLPETGSYKRRVDSRINAGECQHQSNESVVARRIDRCLSSGSL
jgi:hypothetical protein